MIPSTVVERLIRRDRLVVALGLSIVTALAWWYLLRSNSGMHADAAEADMHAAMGMPEMQVWGMAQLAALFVMWAVMMVAMMLPSAAPIILLVVGAYRRRATGAPRLLTAAFSSGYLLAWAGFSAMAAALQLALHKAAVLSPAMVAQSALFGGSVLLVAGVYQWLPLKNACLAHCRSPLGFISREWREGVSGALVMGLRHGLFCIGCCWALMTLLFVAGVMNLVWVAAIAAFVLVEKLTGRGEVSKAAGVLMVLWGIYVFAAAV
jgi:predicted metal-binding membrane protein